MHSLQSAFLEALTFSHAQLATLRALGERRGTQELYTKQTPELLETLRHVALIESAESSNRIEGVTASHKRIEAIVLKDSRPRDRSEQEILGYRHALDLIHESHMNMPFSTNVIRQLHQMLYRFQAASGGQWKQADNEIVEKNPDGTIKRVRFKPTSAVETPLAMEDLTRGYTVAIAEYQKEPLLMIPLAVLDFLCVHPFTDGNGRVARLMTLWLLYQHDYNVGRYISLERIVEEAKETYYETLEASSQGWHQGKHDVFPWLNYFWGILLRAYDEFEQRVGAVAEGKGNKTDQIKASVMRRIGPFAISDIESENPGVSRDMIRLVLRRMRDEGVIILQGKGRGAKWIRKG